VPIVASFGPSSANVAQTMRPSYRSRRLLPATTLYFLVVLLDNANADDAVDCVQ
jgi:hypothetical protein